MDVMNDQAVNLDLDLNGTPWLEASLEVLNRSCFFRVSAVPIRVGLVCLL